MDGFHHTQRKLSLHVNAILYNSSFVQCISPHLVNAAPIKRTLCHPGSLYKVLSK